MKRTGIIRGFFAPRTSFCSETRSNFLAPRTARASINAASFARGGFNTSNLIRHGTTAKSKNTAKMTRWTMPCSTVVLPFPKVMTLRSSVNANKT